MDFEKSTRSHTAVNMDGLRSYEAARALMLDAEATINNVADRLNAIVTNKDHRLAGG